MSCFSSKLDETTQEARLGFLLPQHEYFHQSFVVADCENALLRDTSRGLEGGLFYSATLLGRKEVKSKKGKDAINEYEEFFLLKADATFCNLFVKKYNLNTNVDNTPVLLRKADSKKKESYLHDLVAEALKDLLPFFADARQSKEQLHDFPLTEGRRQPGKSSRASTPPSKRRPLEEGNQIDAELSGITAQQVTDDQLRRYLVKKGSSKSKKIFKCKSCRFQCKYEAVCLTHIQMCKKIKEVDEQKL